MIVVHASDTPPSMDIGADTIRDWHVNGNHWRDIGYNAIIKRDGSIEGGRDLDGDGDFMEESGAHARGYNTNSIGVCLIGGRGADGKADANFTLRQYNSLEAYIRSVENRYGKLKVVGHRDLPNVSKQCPCFDVISLLER